jgi:hypothetical protein
MLSGIITLLSIPRLDQDCIQEEDIKFRDYLEKHGFDTGKMGLPNTKNEDGVEQFETVEKESAGTVTTKGKRWLSKLTGVAP